MKIEAVMDDYASINFANHDQKFGGEDPPTSPAMALVVLGSHRSGTSALSGMLAKLGFNVPGELMPATAHNPKGYFESREIMRFNEEILKQLHSSWDDPLPLPASWERSPLGQMFAADLRKLLQDFAPEPMLLIKDPRICQLSDLWIEALAPLGRTVCVLPGRHPLELARSLQERDQMPRPQALILWLKSVLDAERSTRNLPRSFVLYADLLDDWRSVVRKIGVELNFIWPRDFLRAQDEIDSFLENNLRHYVQLRDDIEPSDRLHEIVGETWNAFQLLVRDCGDTAAMATMDRMSDAFAEAVGFLGPLVASARRELDTTRQDLWARINKADGEIQAHEQESRKASAELAKREQEHADRGNLLASAASEAQVGLAAATTALAELQELAGREKADAAAVLEGEQQLRKAAETAAVAHLAEIQRLQHQIEAAQTISEARENALAAEIAVIREGAETQRKHFKHREAALGAETEDAKAVLNAARSELADTERRAAEARQELELRIAALNSEVEGARDALDVVRSELTDTEHRSAEARQELELRIAALNSEVEGVRGALAVARSELARAERGKAEGRRLADYHAKQVESAHGQELDQLRRELKQQAEEIHVRDARIQAVFASHSWAIGRPFRALVRIARGEIRLSRAFALASRKQP